jgi:hypothetical protein
MSLKSSTWVLCSGASVPMAIFPNGMSLNLDRPCFMRRRRSMAIYFPNRRSSIEHVPYVLWSDGYFLIKTLCWDLMSESDMILRSMVRWRPNIPRSELWCIAAIPGIPQSDCAKKVLILLVWWWLATTNEWDQTVPHASRTPLCIAPTLHVPNYRYESESRWDEFD